MGSWSRDQIAELDTLAKLVREERPRLIHVVRPIYLHARAPEGNRKVCPCGCASKEAVRTEIRPHLEILVDRVRGTRRQRKPYNAEAFDRVAKKAERVEMPVRCYDEQLQPIIDRTHKIIGAFGGARGGKSETAKEFVVDRWAEFGGKGALFVWVAPSREMTRIGVRKLVLGERTNRFCKPAFPRQLVRYYPKNEMSKPQEIILVDGSRILLKYGSRKGASLKGISAVAVVLDEGTECPHEIVWTILTTRTMESGGQLMTSTTPVAGHWLKKLAEEGTPYHALADEQIKTQKVTTTLSCLRNPWISAASVQETIDSMGGPDDPRVQREVFGKWVAEGNRLWRHWNVASHQIEGIGHTPEEFGLINITPIAGKRLFPERNARLDMLGGWDCNDFPMSLGLCYVCVREQDDAPDPTKWIFFVADEIVRRVKSIEDWADYLNVAGQRMGRPEWLRNLSIVADKSTCYADARVNRKGEGADADVLRQRCGFLVRPPAYQNGNASNPSIRDRCNLWHRLMHERRLLIHGRCRKTLESTEEQICDDRGLPLTISGKRSDRLAGPIDAVTYLAYAVFHDAVVQPKTGIVWG